MTLGTEVESFPEVDAKVRRVLSHQKEKKQIYKVIHCSRCIIVNVADKKTHKLTRLNGPQMSPSFVGPAARSGITKILDIMMAKMHIDQKKQ